MGVGVGVAIWVPHFILHACGDLLGSGSPRYQAGWWLVSMDLELVWSQGSGIVQRVGYCNQDLATRTCGSGTLCD